jgi:hypothetical protein
MDEQYERTVMVWGKPHTISVYQKSKTVWAAVGDYMDERIEVKDRSRGTVVAAWRRAAEYRGN